MAASPPPVTLVTGSEDLLVSRAVGAVVRATSHGEPDGELEVRDIEAGAFDDSDLLDLQSPSLFGGARVVVVRGGDVLEESHRDALVRYAGDPLPGVVVVVVHPGGPKGKRLVDGLTAAGATVVTCAAPTRRGERLEFVESEARVLGGQITPGAARLLLETVGADLRDLSMTVAQLLSDNGGVIDEAVVHGYHRGRAETRGFDVADATLSGDVRGALALLGSALDTGTAPVLVTSALASGVRDIARVRGAGQGGSGGNPAGMARALGMPPWKVQKALAASEGWTDDALARALLRTAEADAAVKGAGADPAYALTRAVIDVGRLRGTRR
jgi:DNA polymerase-3 subunit delta